MNSCCFFLYKYNLSKEFSEARLCLYLLKEFIYDESFEYWFPKRTLNKIARIVKQNGGKILRTTRTERLLRKSENNGQM